MGAFVLLLAGGCAHLPTFETAAVTTAAPSAPTAPAPAPTDPMLVFAAAAGPGSESIVEGQRVRVARAYFAASGRECRELLIGSGAFERSAIVCRDDVAGWDHTRPLLRGSGMLRP